jgi:hypothetical protein
MDKFPKYIWNHKTGQLIVYETSRSFINPSEYIDTPLTFDTLEEARQFLKEYNLEGTIGTKIVL